MSGYMPNESELKLIGTAIDVLGRSTDPVDADVRHLLSIALKLRADRGDVIYPLTPPTLSVVEQAAKTSPTKTPFQPADLKIPNHFRDYFTDSLSRFLGQEVVVSLPSQEHVDRGKRIQDAGFPSFEPVVFPNLRIEQDFRYPANWEYHLDPRIYEQITSGNLQQDVLVLKEDWGWLDTSDRLDWKDKDPMFVENLGERFGQLLTQLRRKGRRGGIAVPDYLEHLDRRSPYGVSADETETAVYPALAEIFGAGRDEVTSLTAAQFNFIGNWLYRKFGQKQSWELHKDLFGAGRQLMGGRRGRGGLSGVGSSPSVAHYGYIRFRPLVFSPSAT